MEHQLILDRYRPLGEPLGEGGYGVVLLAWDTRMQRRVAIKRLPLPLDDRGRPSRPPGLDEARTAAMLGHPAIVSVYDFDYDSDEAFLVMEYVDGASLAQVLDSLGGPLDADEAAAVLGPLAEAVEFAHENGVLHLDIKPDNILIGRDGRVKVADFGMAELSTLTGHGSAEGGTLGYMPVEQLTGTTVDERTDEWALAALAYEVLTGDNPFAEESARASVSTIETLDLPPISALQQLPRTTDDVLANALAPAAPDRYGSVAEFADALLPLLGDPASGRASLAELVDDIAAEEDIAEDLGRLGLWDRLSGPGGGVLLRLLAAAQAGWLAWAGLAPLRLEPTALLGAAAVVAVAGALAPGLGVGLGLGCFVVGLAAAGMWLGAGAVLLLGGVWWWFVARRSPGATVLPLAAPLLGVAHLALAQPLAAGFVLPPRKAAATAFAGGALTMLASAISAQATPYLQVLPAYALDIWRADLAATSVKSLLTSPAAAVALIGWPIAGAVMSVGCSRATRTGAALGSAGALAVLGGAYLLADRAATASGLGSGWGGLAPSLAASGALALAVIALGSPVRAEEE